MTPYAPLIVHDATASPADNADNDAPPAQGGRPRRGSYPFYPGYVLIQRDPLVPRAHLTKVLSSATIVGLLQDRLGREDVEVMLVVCLDGHSRVIAIHEVARGGRHSLSAMPAEILRAPIVVGASAIVLAHNHPSGDPTPSDEDYVMTRRVAEAGQIVGVPLVDHVIL